MGAIKYKKTSWGWAGPSMAQIKSLLSLLMLLQPTLLHCIFKLAEFYRCLSSALPQLFKGEPFKAAYITPVLALDSGLPWSLEFGCEVVGKSWKWGLAQPSFSWGLDWAWQHEYEYVLTQAAALHLVSKAKTTTNSIIAPPFFLHVLCLSWNGCLFTYLPKAIWSGQ